MPSRRLHLEFDEYLRERDVICEDTITDSVHDRMDRDILIHGHWSHRYVDYYHDIDGIREWIRRWCRLGYQETLTDYVRVSLGHLVLDEIWSRGEWKDEYDSMKRAYRSFIAKGFDKCYFKE